MAMYSLLWDNFRKGSQAAFKQLYDEYFGRLYAFGLRFTDDADIVETAVQDLFTKLWRNRENIGATTSEKNYLFTAFRRTLIRKINSDGNKKMVFDLDIKEIKNAPIPENTFFSNEESILLKEKLLKMLGSITEHEREIIYLKFYEDFSYEKIAGIMGISVKSAYKLLYKALNKIRSNFQGTEYFTCLIFLCCIAEY